MSYIEKEKLIKADIASIENRVRHAFNQGYDLGYKEGKERAKSQNQEPILDKIRAEIESITPKAHIRTGKLSIDTELMIPLDRVLIVLDKYKGESERNE